MHLNINTIQQQQNLANFCRTGINNKNIAAIRPESLQQYRRLVYNVVDDSLQSVYPIAFEFLEEKNEWDNLVNNFFTNHNCINPQVWQMPYELIEYVELNEHKLLQEYPFLVDLLYFEWIEVEMYMMEDKTIPIFTNLGNVEHSCIVINPEHKIFQLNFPVTTKKPFDIINNDEGNYISIAFRKNDDDKDIMFMNLSPLLAFMLESLSQQALSLNELLKKIEAEHKICIDEETKKELIQFFNHAYQSQLILGFIN